MIDKETFRKTEGQLYGYFRDLKEINDLEVDCKELEEQKKGIESDIENCNVYVDPTKNMCISYNEKVQTSSTGESPAERGIISEIENLEREIKYVDRELRRKRARIRELQRNIAPMKRILTNPQPSQEISEFIKYKYDECKGVEWIATEMYGGVRSTAYRKREDIVEDIVKWEGYWDKKS